MKRRFFTVATLLMCATMLTTSCVGSFSLFNKLASWNKDATGSKFLKDGDKMKVSLRFRGREKDYVARGMEVMNKFAEAVSDVGDIDRKPNFEGRSLTMILTPKSDK